MTHNLSSLASVQLRGAAEDFCKDANMWRVAHRIAAEQKCVTSVSGPSIQTDLKVLGSSYISYSIENR